MPRTTSATRSAVSFGSSENVSKFRPAYGVRMRLAIGERSTSMPSARPSLPMTRPYARASAGSKAEASRTGAGSAVAGLATRTPAGPSARRSAGMPRRGMPGT